MFNIFGTKAKAKKAAEHEALMKFLEAARKRENMEYESNLNLLKMQKPNIPEGFNAMQQLLTPAQLNNAQKKAAAKAAANAKAAENAKDAKLCGLFKQGEEALDSIHSLRDMEYYFNEVQPNMTFPQLRSILQEGYENECVTKFLNAFNAKITSNSAYEHYSDYFQRSRARASELRSLEIAGAPSGVSPCVERLMSQGYGYMQADSLCSGGLAGGKKKRATRRNKRKSRSTRVKSRNY